MSRPISPFCRVDFEIAAEIAASIKRRAMRADSCRIHVISIELPASIQVICENCFLHCSRMASITFVADSRLSRIERGAFSFGDLTSIHLPASLEILCERCISNCGSLRLMTFADGARLGRIEAFVFETRCFTK
jgi:hypothetical protein